MIADGAVAFALPGTYTVKATAIGGFGGTATGHVVIRAVAPGGSTNDALPTDPPAVITARTAPKAERPDRDTVGGEHRHLADDPAGGGAEVRHALQLNLSRRLTSKRATRFRSGMPS